MKKPKRVITTKELQALLKNLIIKCDCGHKITVGHNFASTLIVYSEGGGNLKTNCHNCGY